MADNIRYFPLPKNSQSANIKYVKSISSGGGDGGDMWQQSVETRLTELKEETKSLRTDMGHRFDALDRRFNGFNGRFDVIRDKQERDFRILFGALIVASLGLASIMATGFGWL